MVLDELECERERESLERNDPVDPFDMRVYDGCFRLWIWIWLWVSWSW